MNSELWLREDAGAKRFLIALGLAALIELAVFGLLLPMMVRRPPPSDHQSIVKLSVIAPAPPAPPAPPLPKPVPPPPKPLTPPPPVPAAPPKPLPPPPRVAHHVLTRHLPPPKHITAPPVVQPPTPPPPAAAPAAPSAGELDLFEAAMRRAVQAAAVSPAAAELAHEAGVARVSFTYQDGVVSGITVTASSGFPLLDQAAMQAVRDAQFPPQPPDFAGRADLVQVDVIFRAAAADVDGD